MSHAFLILIYFTISRPQREAIVDTRQENYRHAQCAIWQHGIRRNASTEIRHLDSECP